ncbi:hypothetical protein J2S40_004664 [Nocardioides luteus]|uniref:WhiB family transcriptional regulator n=1 Tax=Nocardioides luteus TaxID=1844 RepID=UPI002861830F|nr:WhiB family transcriptional regulator [Nocardioides luteus]MDR7313606.1 hypothetical protein [Nocardioides luteus]
MSTWMDYAACTTREKRGLPWTTDASQTPTVLVDLMQETCDACPVRLACEAYATRNRVTGGWWGGVDRAPDPEDLLDLLDALPAAALLDGAA